VVESIISVTSFLDRLGIEGEQREIADRFFADRRAESVEGELLGLVAKIQSGSSFRTDLCIALGVQYDITSSSPSEERDALEDVVDALLTGHLEDDLPPEAAPVLPIEDFFRP
jgi:hypothetical protein